MLDSVNYRVASENTKIYSIKKCDFMIRRY